MKEVAVYVKDKEEDSHSGGNNIKKIILDG
jgi:hypothetical protein